MRFPLSHRWLFLIGILSIGALFASANPANASCGDYLQIIPKTDGSPNSDSPMAPHKPCSGSSCQKFPVIPAPLPIPTFTVTVQPLDAILPSTFEVVETSKFMWPEQENSATCRGHLDSIFHPPR